MTVPTATLICGRTSMQLPSVSGIDSSVISGIPHVKHIIYVIQSLAEIPALNFYSQFRATVAS